MTKQKWVAVSERENGFWLNYYSRVGEHNVWTNTRRTPSAFKSNLPKYIQEAMALLDLNDDIPNVGWKDAEIDWSTASISSSRFSYHILRK